MISNKLPTTRIGCATEIPLCTSDKWGLESGIDFVRTPSGRSVLSHSLRHEQIIGSSDLPQLVAGATDPNCSEHLMGLREALLKLDFLVPPGECSNRYKRKLMAREDSRPLVRNNFTLLRVLLTDVCNLACSYCKVIPNISSPQKKPTPLPKLKRALDFFFKNSEAAKAKIIHITGGEPTLFQDRIFAIIDYCRDLARPGENYWIVIGTNATRVTPEFASLLAASRVKCIVSMDGPKHLHDTLRHTHGHRGSWDQVDKGLNILIDAGVEISISTVFGRTTLKHADEVIDYILNRYAPTGLGVNFMKPPTPDNVDYAELVSPADYAHKLYSLHQQYRSRGLFLELVFRKLLPFVYQEYRFHDCGAAAGGNLNVDAKGNAGPCKSFLVMNKLALKKFSAASYAESVVSKWRLRSPIYYNFCGNCSAQGICGNGCAYDAHVHSGDEMGIDFRACEYTKVFHSLFLNDLTELCNVEFPVGGFHVVQKEDRLKLLGKARAIENSLSYSIGHHQYE